ncbi:hypothetical protein KL905_000301 [Ogataea polymorpha]|uniref:Uncharacterized protein n=1 Tax=Ogataea polymorpha TaxID=460523 RepID=A0A1B7SIQ7_9ASCO|nr:uncharacterized protein OGAPODRAFT_16092 [Ogataea polymorpha]KAG7882205.1 hypothetical protein KL937_000776 [Ogataea polymorpha]KAG7891711.1 hypothetical protein KL936_001654 [Ogataea polymorpha]KAG7895064.1 hypothetical protein KL908_001414 [Ogataea polymorpha]KAG7902454.1 hypothetical protein KL935_001362 [Ogataea polymorpha]KAG7911558.1 hypothetical protein KL906_000879 [Ogataea polymorpha]
MSTHIHSAKSFTNPFHLSLRNLQVADKQGDPIYYVGVDVGTGSARAAVVDQTGAILGLAERPITRNELKANFITQSSTEIWDAICYCVKTAISQSHVDPANVLGIGFDATCSLVAINEKTDEPMAVGPDFTDDLENIILWMDHRAEVEVNEINATHDECLKYVGGKMSIEMELPKMKWLKNHMPKDANGESLFKQCKFYDLADFLTHKATGSETRSFCSTVCKQGYIPEGITNRNGWSSEFLNKIDLPELVEDNFRRLGGVDGVNGKFLSAGETVGSLTERAAEQLGLTTDCYVGSGVIDAYAGWIGTVAAQTETPIADLVEQDKNNKGMAKAKGRLAAVAGTSTCHICLDDKPIFVDGVWGPYRDVMAKGFWLAEGGQSCTGALLAHVLSTHPAYMELGVASEASGTSRFDFLNSRLEQLKKSTKERSVVALAKNLFFYGDFHGNRSPIADPQMRASIIGQSMDTSLDSLAVEYLAACEFIGQQTRHIIEKMEVAGYDIKAIFMSGGQCRNGLLMRLLADCTGLPIVIPRYIDASVVFGSAMLGAVAAEDALKNRKGPNSKSRRNSAVSNLDNPQSQTDQPPSPYTAPSATASMTSISALAAGNAQSAYPFPTMTPIEDESKQLGANLDASDDDEDAQLSFGSKSRAQATATKNFISKKTGTGPGDKLWKVMTELSGVGRIIYPSSETDPDRKLLNTKYKIFLDQIETQQRYRAMVAKTEEAIKAYLNI